MSENANFKKMLELDDEYDVETQKRGRMNATWKLFI